MLALLLRRRQALTTINQTCALSFTKEQFHTTTCPLINLRHFTCTASNPQPLQDIETKDSYESRPSEFQTLNTPEQHGVKRRHSHQALILDGRTISSQWQDELASQVQHIRSTVGRPPGLGVVLVGERPDSQLYVSRKLEACERVGMYADVRHLPSSVSQRDLRSTVQRLCSDPLIDGILVQLPLPAHIDEEDVIESFDPAKDVDGFHPLNVGRTLMRGRTARFVPCTALGCIELLQRSNISIKDASVVIVGDSNIVGMPLAMLFRDAGAATVTVVHRSSYSGLFGIRHDRDNSVETAETRALAEACLPRTPGPDGGRQPYEVSYTSNQRKTHHHHHTNNRQGNTAIHHNISKHTAPPAYLAELAAMTRTADILVVAVGYPQLVKRDWIKPGAVVLDVGINVVDDKYHSDDASNKSTATTSQAPVQSAGIDSEYHVVGDVDFCEVSSVASAITPVPGGIGPMTIAAVLHNTIQAAKIKLHVDDQ